ncbi:MAG TPA: hypothetical protein VIU15_17520 [Streptomyces sp.]
MDRGRIGSSATRWRRRNSPSAPAVTPTSPAISDDPHPYRFPPQSATSNSAEVNTAASSAPGQSIRRGRETAGNRSAHHPAPSTATPSGRFT